MSSPTERSRAADTMSAPHFGQRPGATPSLPSPFAHTYAAICAGRSSRTGGGGMLAASTSVMPQVGQRPGWSEDTQYMGQVYLGGATACAPVTIATTAPSATIHSGERDGFRIVMVLSSFTRGSIPLRPLDTLKSCAGPNGVDRTERMVWNGSRSHTPIFAGS